jgi:uncharacterized protein YciI
LDGIPSLGNSLERASQLEHAEDRLRSAKGTQRSFKMEIRLVQDIKERRRLEQRHKKMEQDVRTLQADLRALQAEEQRGELFVSGGGSRPDGDKDPSKAGSKMLAEASALQDKTQDSLSNTKQLIAQSKEVGVSTLEELQRQREVIQNIEKETDRMDDNLARAEALLKHFGKRMASDKFIQCFAVLNCLLLLGVILYAVMKGGKLGGEESAPKDPTGGRLLRGGMVGIDE